MEFIEILNFFLCRGCADLFLGAPVEGTVRRGVGRVGGRVGTGTRVVVDARVAGRGRAVHHSYDGN